MAFPLHYKEAHRQPIKKDNFFIETTKFLIAFRVCDMHTQDVYLNQFGSVHGTVLAVVDQLVSLRITK